MTLGCGRQPISVKLFSFLFVGNISFTFAIRIIFPGFFAGIAIKHLGNHARSNHHKAAIVKLELGNTFNEFSVALEPLVKLREDAKAGHTKPERGRPQKFILRHGLL